MESFAHELFFKWKFVGQNFPDRGNRCFSFHTTTNAESKIYFQCQNVSNTFILMCIPFDRRWCLSWTWLFNSRRSFADNNHGIRWVTLPAATDDFDWRTSLARSINVLTPILVLRKWFCIDFFSGIGATLSVDAMIRVDKIRHRVGSHGAICSCYKWQTFSVKDQSSPSGVELCFSHI